MLFRRLSTARAAPALKSIPAGTLVYAIGDVHGRADLLSKLLELLREDAGLVCCKRRVLVFLGDYIDRGPQSRDVVDLMIRLQDEAAFEVAALKGNHDQALLDFLSDPSTGPNWCDFGGAAALRSYGVEPPRMRVDTQAWAHTAERLTAAMPAEHLKFFQSLRLTHIEGDYFFAHAGARPGVPLDAQKPRDLLFIRNDFLGAAESFDRIVVHGHTPEEDVYVDDRRIGVDTGAYATGTLSAVRLVGIERAKIQVKAVRGREIEFLGLEPL